MQYVFIEHGLCLLLGVCDVSINKLAGEGKGYKQHTLKKRILFSILDGNKFYRETRAD